MSATTGGALLGTAFGLGLVLLLSRAVVVRRPDLSVRVLPYIRDLPQVARSRTAQARRHRSPFHAVFAPLLSDAAAGVERVLGGSTSIRRRLERANLPLSVHDFRVEQVLWGLVGLGVSGCVSIVVALRAPDRTLPLLILCAVCFVTGILLRENRLSVKATARERLLMTEFPTVAELLALAVGAGEGPVAAIDRVAARCRGEMADELRRVLADIRTGTPVAAALDELAARSGLPAVARFAEAMAVAIERGTPLAAVLHAQAADAREAGRRALIESGARREVLMMVPVVFLVLPVTVLFAFWPGVVGLNLVTP
ncbi:type II secretion system F family protein [Nocardioides mesophilus]|uniref:Type II secretion system F family protein n=1 Tax=Nocardioides mesophilus TaxID=433659 RepID=A0A7G9RD83_9ACTN|nr:type II secretion system F family protein [Nocardioides mesophilus]QNN53558.1 type II secretion system F family protein [Nocardioides mesophilus]